MHKPVRYYITESNDQPVVRSVAVSKRDLQVGERSQTQTEHSSDQTRGQAIRTTLSRRLKPHWPRHTDV